MIDGGIFLITGASSGIGRELARQLGPHAAGMALVARRADRLASLADELRESAPHLVVTVHPCDLTDLDAATALVDAVLGAHGSVDVLVNNAGLGDITLLESSSMEKNIRQITLNVTALTLLTHRVLPGMVSRRRGVVLNVSSGFGLVPMPGFATYVGTKHYVSSFTEALHGELAGTGVLASHLCPGPVKTEFEQHAGNPLEQSPPAFVYLSAEACARAAIRGIRRGRARIIPHLLMGVVTPLSRGIPDVLIRLFNRVVGRMLRSRLLS
jgi:hypothetical protein